MRRVELYKVKIFIKGLFIVEKQRLMVEPFLPYHGQIFDFCGPKTRDASTM